MGANRPRRVGRSMIMGEIPHDQRTSRTIAVSPELVRHVDSKRVDYEATEDTLRRLLGLPQRKGQ